MTLPGRTHSSTAYRYGFQGQEKDDELKGEGNSLNYTFRMHDPRVGRFFAVDPLERSYPWNSAYAFSENRVIDSGELEGLERYYSADGKLLGKYGASKEMRIVKQSFIDLLNKYDKNIKNLIKSPPNKNTISIFNKESVQAFENTGQNQTEQLSSWAKTNRNPIKEKAMSLFTKQIENPDGKGYIDVFTLGTTAEGPNYEPGYKATVAPDDSIGLDGWKRSTTIHTHPWGGPLNFSNEVRGFGTGGDYQWAMYNNIDLYLVPPSGNEMGVFSVELYKKLVRSKLGSYDSYYKNMSDSDMFEEKNQMTPVGDPISNKAQASSKVEIK